VNDFVPYPSDPSAAPIPLRQQLLRTALIVLVLGVLPLAWGAEPAWQVLGVSVSLVMIARSVQLVWRAVFSTDPRHLAAY
jgi:hypothetical protein